MTFQTNRIYYLLSRDYRKSLLFDAVLLLFFVISYIQDPGEPLVELFSISLILVLYNLIRIGARPKEFVVERDRVTCSAWFKKDYRSIGYVRVRNGSSSKRVNVHILRVSEIMMTYYGYHKARRVGTLRLYGEIHAKDKNDDFVEDVIIPAYIDLYGVLDVESAIAALHESFPSAEMTETNPRTR